MSSEAPHLEREPSALMQKLNRMALEAARDKVASKFRTAADLEDFESFKSQLQKANDQAESQLSLAMQGKLEALKRAKDIMDESSVKLNTLFSSVKKTDEMIASTNTEITKYEYLCRINFAKENIHRVLSQVNSLPLVPEKVKKLNELLDNEPARLKEVFKETIQLDALRKALIKETKAQEGSARRRQSAVDTKSRGGYSDESSARVKDILEKYLHMVPDLMKRVKGTIYGYVDRFMEVGIDNPHDLVMCFEVTEMYQEYLDRRKEQNIRRAIELNRMRESAVKDNAVVKYTDPEVAGQEDFEDFKDEIQNRVKKVLLEKVQVRFEVFEQQGNEEGSDQKESEVMRVLHAATQLMSLMTDFKNELIPCFPEDYNCMQTLVETVEEHIVPQVTSLVESNKITKLDVADILKLIDWIEYYVAQMKIFECSDVASVKEFLHITYELKNEYVVRIKQQIETWFDNIENRPKEIAKTHENLLITSHPEDMFNCLYSQVAVAKAKLPADHMKDVISTCFAALRTFQRKAFENLNNNWREYDVEMLCALINDNQRMLEKCDEFADKSLLMIPDHQSADLRLLELILDEVASDYASLAKEGVNVLCRCILIDLDEAVFSKIYTAEWETGTQLTETLVATLEDYLNDIKGWIPTTFFDKLVEQIFTLSVDLYCMSLRKLSNGAFHFMNELVATGIVTYDLEIFKNYFNKFEHILSRGKNIYADGLDVMSVLATLISATRLAEIEENTVTLFRKYNYDGLKLSQAIILANPRLSNGEKTHFCNKLIKNFEEGVYEKTPNPLFENFDAVNIETQKPEPKKTSSLLFWKNNN